MKNVLAALAIISLTAATVQAEEITWSSTIKDVLESTV